VTSERSYYIYLLTDWNNKVMYVGITNDLERRIYEHKNKVLNGFTEKYNIDKFVYFEHTPHVTAALEREKEIKKWRREKKNNLVQDQNPAWKDLSEEWGERFLPSVEMTSLCLK
jgi:putative endonuclease